jgi:hypothetical protein
MDRAGFEQKWVQRLLRVNRGGKAKRIRVKDNMSV